MPPQALESNLEMHEHLLRKSTEQSQSRSWNPQFEGEAFNLARIC